MFVAIRCLLVWLSILCLSSLQADEWPGWRGPRGDGHSAETSLPTKWDQHSNVAWKIDLAGDGHASPVVWGERLFLVSCDKSSGARKLTTYNAHTGSVMWERKVIDSPLETKHSLNSYASSTPATDGQHVYVTFLESDNRTVVATNVSAPRDVTIGRMVVAAYDMQGQQKWLVRSGDFVSVHGYCTCPVLFGNLLILNGDHDGESFIVALDKRNGQEIWRVAREHKTRSYVTPIIRDFGGRTQMILCGSKSVTSYEPSTGKLIWHMDGPTEQFVASMVDDGQRVFLTAGYPDRHILAIDPTGTGNVTDSHVLWRSKKNCAYVPSPIVVGSYFLVTSDDGIASCYDASSGERLWFERLGNHYSTSPIAAAGLVYFTADNGITKVVRPGRTFELISENSLGEACYASAAASAGHLFYRTTGHLVSIGAKP
ncbi:MAG: PQQ-binding-like beta-propeller repeat protein [Pirellulaceae bacterium]|nr:PQQ-binding-like beta-propeller repeat protein [Pirellulaceae bacterium]